MFFFHESSSLYFDLPYALFLLVRKQHRTILE